MSGTVAKPRIFIDYIAYARAIGKPVIYALTVGADGQYPDVFTLNPQKTNIITTDGATTILKCGINNALLNGDANGSDRSIEFSKLIQSVNYWGLLGHNLDDIGVDVLLGGLGNTASYTDFSSTELSSSIDKRFMLRTTSGFADNPNESFGVGLKFIGHPSGDQIKIGSFTMGRRYTFPHNANLSMNINYSQDGISRTRTSGGSDIVNVNYYKSPDWGEHKPWSYAEQDTRDTGYAGRRSWDLTFSYLQKEDTFPQDMNDDFMFNQTGDFWANHSTQNITSHFMTLTLNGQIPFIFQPDDTLSTFALCRLKSNTFSVQQSAPNLYTCQMSFEETW